ncbi:MAG: hypothetical protein U5L02_05275 [Rheinheimera sp.]|nr:hypothetical protein [Rheinheimera sp.]
MLTHESDFFDYLESVFKANSMNQQPGDELEQMERFIFLGLPYEKWYFQLLLRVLAFHTDKFKDIERFALQEFENPNYRKSTPRSSKLSFSRQHWSSSSANSTAGAKLAAAAKILCLPPTPQRQPSPTPRLPPSGSWPLMAKREKALPHLKVFLDRRKPRSYQLAT